MAILGTKRTTPGTNRLTPTEQQIGVTIGNFPADGRITKLGEWTGYASGSSVTKRFAAYLHHDGEPQELLGATTAQAIATAYTTDGGGTNVEGAITSVRSGRGATQRAIVVRGGETIALASLDTIGASAHSLGGSPNATQKTRRFKTNATGTPSDPFAQTSTDNNTNSWLHSFYADYTLNRPPVTTRTAPANGATVSTLTPTLSFSITDPDRTDNLGDYPAEIRIQVYELSGPGGSIVTQTWTMSRLLAVPADGTGAVAVDVVYAGTPLEYGKTYGWKGQGVDELGLSSSTGDPLNEFTISAGGAVTTTAPLGKQDDLSPNTFSGTYAHNGGLSADKVRVRVLGKAGGSYAVLQTGTLFDLSPNVAPAGTISLTWAQTGLVDLEWNRDYAVEWQVTDTSAVVGDWTGLADFHTDYTPSTPSGLTPTGNPTYTSPPVLIFTLTDADDDIASGLTATVEITTPTPSVLTRTATKDPTGNIWRYQTVNPTDLPSTGSYSWRARGNDGTQDGAWSGAATFQFLTGPVVTVTAPATTPATVATNTPAVTWTVAGNDQVRYRVLFIDQATLLTAYDSGWISSVPLRTATVPTGWLHEGTTYTYRIEVEGAGSLVGASVNRTIIIDYPAPDTPAAFTATPTLMDLDDEASAIFVSWTAVDTAPIDFVRYVLAREEQGRPETRIVVATFTSPSITTYTENFPPSGKDFTYLLKQEVYQGTDVRESAWAEAAARVDLMSAVLCDAVDPATYRVPLKWFVNRDLTLDQDQSFATPAGGMSPVASVGTLRSREVTFTVTLRAKAVDGVVEVTAAAYKAAFDALYERQRVVMYRDWDGEAFFGVFVGRASFGKDFATGDFQVRAAIRRVEFSEGPAA